MDVVGQFGGDGQRECGISRLYSQLRSSHATHCACLDTPFQHSCLLRPPVLLERDTHDELGAAVGRTVPAAILEPLLAGTTAAGRRAEQVQHLVDDEPNVLPADRGVAEVASKRSHERGLLAQR